MADSSPVVSQTSEPFFGRKDELSQLHKVLDDPRGQAVLVVGPQGMGKSALIARFLAEAEVSATHPCGTIYYWVPRNERPDFVLQMLMADIEEAVQNESGFLALTPRGRTQLKAIFSVLPRGEKILKLLKSLRGQTDRHPRAEFIRLLTALSERLPAERRFVIALDAEKQLDPASDDEWRLVAKQLPDKVMLVLGQRPDDALASSGEFCGLPNVRRIPDGDLNRLSSDAVEECLAWASNETGLPLPQMRKALGRYDGHPYALVAAVELLRDSLSIEDLPSDPTPEKVARSQWDQIKSTHGPAAMRLLKAHAILEVPVPDSVAREVAQLDGDTHESPTRSSGITSQPCSSMKMRANTTAARPGHIARCSWVLENGKSLPIQQPPFD